MLGELWRQYKHERNVDAREELVVKCLPMVKALVQRFALYTSPCCDADDLISVGIIGLLDAVEKYDPVMRASFRTYAKYRIRGAMLDEIRALQWVPRSIQEKMQSLRRAYTHLEQDLSRPPTEGEIADALDMDLHQFHRMLTQIGPPTILTLSQKRSENKDPEHREIAIEDPKTIYPVDQLISDETKLILANAIRSLPEREAMVITLYYYEEMTMKEIGEILSLTESRICQIHARALIHLLQAMDSESRMMADEGTERQEAVAD